MATRTEHETSIMMAVTDIKVKALPGADSEWNTLSRPSLFIWTNTYRWITNRPDRNFVWQFYEWTLSRNYQEGVATMRMSQLEEERFKLQADWWFIYIFNSRTIIYINTTIHQNDVSCTIRIANNFLLGQGNILILLFVYMPESLLPIIIDQCNIWKSQV